MVGRRSIALALPIFVAALAVGAQAGLRRSGSVQPTPRAFEYGIQVQIPGQTPILAGEHVAPFVCHIGDKWLKIDATVRVTGPKGEVFETETARALKRASKISQTNVTWAWTADDPRKAQ